ncbi:hypothetical protein E3P99_02495 [Wallemia hederae]|uniref:Mitochondrial import inner membrane translocase subunit TIM44 n=1 Tax=Wallemia hederae TaxID=1540922 RepID=A0A4T0FLK0_9BASI|nr:hypothetical protein E3P99_02495 [Wallemia hederae]
MNYLKLSANTLAKRSFTSSARRFNAPESPFSRFVNVLREELRKNAEFQENYKQLSGEAGKVQDSEAMQRARDAYQRATIANLMKNNPRLKAATDNLRKNGGRVSDGVGEALRGIENTEAFRALLRATNATYSAVNSATAPIRDTEAYKTFAETISDALDDTSRGGYEDREARRLRRQRRLAKAGKDGIAKKRVKKDEQAGEALVLHEDANQPSKWQEYKENSAFFQRVADLREQYHDSESPTVLALRSVTDRIGGLFEENETARVTRAFKALDPDFTQDNFLIELREYIVPEVVDAYLNADKDALRRWCGEATYNVLWASMEVYLSKGLISDSKVVDIRAVEISKGQMLDNDVPVWLVIFHTQEILMFRDAKSGEVVVGAEDGVEQVAYVGVFTRVEDELEDELTGGWKVIEMARRGQKAYI